MTKIVVDTCLSLKDSGKTVTRDNHCMSPEVAVALKDMNVHVHGTVHSNRFGFPKAVCHTKSEARKLPRGKMQDDG